MAELSAVHAAVCAADKSHRPAHGPADQSDRTAHEQPHKIQGSLFLPIQRAERPAQRAAHRETQRSAERTTNVSDEQA